MQHESQTNGHLDLRQELASLRKIEKRTSDHERLTIVSRILSAAVHARLGMEHALVRAALECTTSVRFRSEPAGLARDELVMSVTKKLRGEEVLPPVKRDGLTTTEAESELDKLAKEKAEQRRREMVDEHGLPYVKKARI